MKINVTVDLSDFYSEDDGLDFSYQIKQHIASQVKNDVMKDFREKIFSEFSEGVKKEINSFKTVFLDSELQKLVSEKKIKAKYGEDSLNVSEFIEKEFDSLVVSGSDLDRKLKQSVISAADGFGKSLKDRYDLLFASQLVAKMNEVGLLKDNVADLLLEKK